ncbi:MAG: hypothetical protein NOI47_000431 [Candidatus Phytoplasma pruni]|nr:hypothetical protein [Candidatus Phytoplasma pruni]
MVLSKKKPIKKELNIIMILSMVLLLFLSNKNAKLFTFIKIIFVILPISNLNINLLTISAKLLLFISVIVFLKLYHIFNKPKPSSFMKVFLMLLVVGNTA